MQDNILLATEELLTELDLVLSWLHSPVVIVVEAITKDRQAHQPVVAGAAHCSKAGV